MKMRNSFVSNSSSCSFVIGKYFMTEEQIEKFRNFISFLEDYEYEKNFGNLDNVNPEFLEYVSKHKVRLSEGNVPLESRHYFLGTIDQSIINPICEFLTEVGVSNEYFDMAD